MSNSARAFMAAKHGLMTLFGYLTIDDDDRQHDPAIPWTLSCSKCWEAVALTVTEEGAVKAALLHNGWHTDGTLNDQGEPTRSNVRPEIDHNGEEVR